MARLALQLRYQVLGLANVQGMAQHPVGGQFLQVWVGETEDDFGVADGQPGVAHKGLELGREPEQAQGVGDDHSALADPVGGVLLGQLKLLNQLGKALGFLDWIEVFALEILDQREFEGGAVVGFADDHGDLGQADELGGAPAAFPGDEFVAVFRGSDDEGLDDAAFPDRIGQFAQRLFGEILTGLEGTWANGAQRHVEHAGGRAFVRIGCCRGNDEIGRRFGRYVPEKRAQAASQSRLDHGRESVEAVGACRDWNVLSTVASAMGRTFEADSFSEVPDITW